MDTTLDSSSNAVEYKITFVGDCQCGKTALIHRFLHDKFLEVYTPTGFQRYSSSCDIGDTLHNFTIWDTSGFSPYDTIRPLAYQDTRVFMLCFHIGQPDSLDNIVKKWYPEVRKHCPDVPVILCGCQSDARSDSQIVSALARQRKLPVSFDQATSAGNEIQAACYVETSSKISSKSVKNALEIAVILAIGKLQKNTTGVQRQRSFCKVRFKSKPKVNLKSEIRGKAKSWNCTLM